VSNLGSQSPYPSQPPPGAYQQAPPPPAPVRTGRASGPRSGFWRRFAAAFVDGLVLTIPNLIFLAAFDYAMANLLSLIVGIAYFTYFEGGPTGQTLGKRALGIRVIDFKAGGPIGYGRGLLRYVARFLSGLVFFLGYFWMLWDPEKQTWHDKIAGTVVVPVEAYPVR
jgi:uncharacterized RDD family membrane protein YckC